MTDDELTLLSMFRAEVPEADPDTARRVYEKAIAAPTSRRALGLGSRPAITGVALVLALVVAPVAIAFSRHIVDFFEGTPAPDAVRAAFDASNRAADAAVRKGFAAKFPNVDIRQAHGVVETQTADGPADLWAAPNDQGGQCWFIDFANDQPIGNGQQPGSGGCDPAVPPGSKITWGEFWVVHHSHLVTIYGHLSANAASLKLTLADGSASTIPIVDRFFLTTLSRDARIVDLSAYDSKGKAVARTFGSAFRQFPPPGSSTAQWQWGS
jgi:hypothetical protein